MRPRRRFEESYAGAAAGEAQRRGTPTGPGPRHEDIRVVHEDDSPLALRSGAACGRAARLPLVPFEPPRGAAANRRRRVPTTGTGAGSSAALPGAARDAGARPPGSVDTTVTRTPDPSPPRSALPQDEHDEAVRAAYRRGSSHLLSQQHQNGCWEGEMVWNTMILSQYVLVRALTHRPLPPHHARAAVHHYRLTRTRHGAWGFHPDAPPSPYCTTLAYVALRVLGTPADDPLCRQALDWIHAVPGGVSANPSWGTFWLALAGLSDYRAMPPVPPEAFLLPRALPFHPDRFYCHTRTVYQAMAWLYGTRFQGELGDLTAPLRQELHQGRRPRRSDRARLRLPDAQAPPSAALRTAHHLVALYERRPFRALRARALARCLSRVVHEQGVTAHAGLSPVSSLLNILVLYADDPRSEAVDAALAAMDQWRWLDPERGLRFAGARSQTWDTSFAVEALTAAGAPHPPVGRAVERARAFLRGAQVTQEIENPAVTARAPALGGWCFSDGSHRWPVSDCTAEALNALLPAHSPTLPARSLDQAVTFLLQRQNPDGGFGTYEARRAGTWLEALNPSEMYSRCMVEGSYVECTGSALTALTRATDHLPPALRARTRRAVESATRFLLDAQLDDGSWPAAWGVNRVYGTFFAVRGLRASGLPVSHPAFASAARWLARTQRGDGGWGEHHRGCLEDRYVPHHSTQPVTTAWAVLALMEAQGPTAVIARGVDWLVRGQRADGGWTQLHVTGVFFGTGMLRYEMYATYFPLWALGRWLSRGGAAKRATPAS
ncbi:prenyltransferase/squalene oxidase repeat-containing protein [Streptomyces sp. NPDC001941]|uniref:prenyltransferase/squalene oxidase repeat-containing protein n=1 Tax=Streptomyces sp. NPDC001941 TaxID=3154659 RepID=UPI00331B264C